MPNWLQEVTLEGEYVSLIPLSLEHESQLVAAAKDGELWKLWFTSVPDRNTISNYLIKAIEQKETGTSLPFVVYSKVHQKIVGTTRFCNIDSTNKRVEIGYTWYARSAQKNLSLTQNASFSC